MDACSFYLDIDAVSDKPECINDFDKLMKCGSGELNELLNIQNNRIINAVAPKFIL